MGPFRARCAGAAVVPGPEQAVALALLDDPAEQRADFRRHAIMANLSTVAIIIVGGRW